jgi:hypothetical protein
VVAQERKLPNLKELWQMTSTFAFVTFAWVFFRAKDMGESLGYLERICSNIINKPMQFLSLPSGKMAFLYILPLILGDWWFRRNERGLKLSNIYLESTLTALIIILLILNFSKESDFIYFQF